MRVAVVGSGVSGLACAGRLAAAGARVVVLDKGFRAGGRVATRGGGAFDHGAQYFTARSPDMVAATRAWEAAGAVRRWEPDGGFAALEWGRADAWKAVAARKGAPDRWVGVPGMSAVPAAMAEALAALPGAPVEVRQRATATAIRRCDGDGGRKWAVDLAEGPPEEGFDAVVTAMPPPQAARLLPDGPVARRAAEARMGGCWALMLGFDRRLELPFDAAFVNAPGGARRGQAPGSLAGFDGGGGDDDDGSSPPFTWLARNSSKPGRDGAADRWVLHSSPHYLERRADAAPDDVARELLAAFNEGVRAPLGAHADAPSHCSAHRWRFSFPLECLDEPFLWDAESGLGACGDWLSGARVEGAHASGDALGRAMAASLSGSRL